MECGNQRRHFGQHLGGGGLARRVRPLCVRARIGAVRIFALFSHSFTIISSQQQVSFGEKVRAE